MAAGRRSRWRARERVWLALALLLFGTAAWLLARGDEPPPPTREIAFPRGLRPAERQRLERRRTLAPGPAPASADVDAATPAPRRDPVLAALAAVPGRSAVVIEANAIRHSPVGRLLIDCLFPDGDRADLDRLRDRLGFDPLEDVDRVGFSGDVALVSGFFGGARWEALAADRALERWGDRARFVEQGDGTALAIWGDEMILFGPDRRAVEAAIDRLEGRAPAAPAIDETATYGEIYGVLAGAEIAALLPEEDGLRRLFREAAGAIELHVDASGDVAIAADVAGPDAAKVRDLGRSLGAAIALARLQAKARGEAELAEVLGWARVEPRGDRFGLELALPRDFLERTLGPACRRRRAPAPEAIGAPPGPATDAAP